MAVKDKENRNRASQPTRSEAMEREDLDLYASISSFSLDDVCPCPCPPPGGIFLVDSCLRSKSISAFCDAIVSLSSVRADGEDDSCWFCLVMVVEDDRLMNANCDGL